MTDKIKENVIENLKLLMDKVFDDIGVEEEKRVTICKNILDKNNNLGNIVKYNIIKNDNFDLLESIKADIVLELIEALDENSNMVTFKSTISSLSKVIVDLNNIYTRSYYNIEFDLYNEIEPVVGITDSAGKYLAIEGRYLREFISKIILAIDKKTFEHPTVDLDISFDYTPLEESSKNETYDMKIGVAFAIGVLFKYVECLLTSLTGIGDPGLEIDYGELLDTLDILSENNSISPSYEEKLKKDTSNISDYYNSDVGIHDFSKLYPKTIGEKWNHWVDEDLDDDGFTTLD